MQEGGTSQKIKKIVDSIKRYLSTHLTEEGYQERTFYAEAFAARLLEETGESDLAARARMAMHKKFDKADEVRHHGEFIQYAYVGSTGYSDSITVERFSNLREKGTNWIILRWLLRVQQGSYLARCWHTGMLWLLLLVNQKPSGIILDRRIGRMIAADKSDEYFSDQYHAFMLVLLTDWYQVQPRNFLKKRIQNGLAYSISQVEMTGEAIQRGRGKKQIFGYVSLVYVLAWIKNRGRDSSSAGDVLERIVAFIDHYHNDAAHPLPLVLTDGQQKDFWETYNNYYDYLAFSGWMLFRSLELINS